MSFANDGRAVAGPKPWEIADGGKDQNEMQTISLTTWRMQLGKPDEMPTRHPEISLTGSFYDVYSRCAEHHRTSGDDLFTICNHAFNQWQIWTGNTREPGHITDAEAVAAQAARIRDLVSETVAMERTINELRTKLGRAAREHAAMRDRLIQLRSRLTADVPPSVYNELSAILEPGD